MADKRICIGKITAPHGIKGLVKILPLCEDTSLLNGAVYTDEQNHDTIEIKLKNKSGKYILAEIAGITSREDAENSRCSLFVSRETLPDLSSNDEYYVDDLKGLTVKSQNNEEIGKVIDVQNYGAGPLLEIQPKSANSYFLPFRDENIVDVDLESGIVIVQNQDDFIL